MDTYNREFISIFFFQSPQLRKYVGAVDSTVSPEIKYDYLPTKLFHGEGIIGVDPLHVFWEFGCS